jgi:hypothetical protein
VARLFGLFGPRVLADNQGVVSDANQALGGRSVLLCGQHGEHVYSRRSNAARLSIESMLRA